MDGYNVLFKFVDYVQLTRPSHPVAKAQSFEDQRDAFQVSTNAYSHFRGVKVVIAYDAMNRPTDPVFVDIRSSSRYIKCNPRPLSLASGCCSNAFISKRIALCGPIHTQPLGHGMYYCLQGSLYITIYRALLILLQPRMLVYVASVSL